MIYIAWLALVIVFALLARAGRKIVRLETQLATARTFLASAENYSKTLEQEHFLARQALGARHQERLTDAAKRVVREKRIYS